ncbi:CBF/Mak21 family-domain-containing protein [Echria macrotheca]|uniref:CBF/Mak21 family-domain-containing protein n=1 Tax=Echria macrotheca TaxID=438768 RepID=A0AAJ0BFX9_9PEZI|nr:CBF/Mak21 family-domain-containing protein [Echria macrotheca]
MGSTRTKRKNKGAAPGFDEAALAKLTATLDTALPTKLSGGEQPSKRKRPNDVDDGPGSKKRQAGSASGSSKRGSNPHEVVGSKDGTSNPLLDEILALGGDKDDYDLVANIDSDNEDGPASHANGDASTKLDQSLQDELMRFASSLGFQNLSTRDDPDTDTDAPENAENSEDEEVAGEEVNVKDIAPPVNSRQGKHGKLIFEPRPDWHNINMDGLPTVSPGPIIKQYSPSIANLKAYGEGLLERDSSAYAAMQASSSTQKFMSTIMSSGTLSDKISALTLSIQESPLHTRKAFESLISLAAKKSRGQAIAALGAIVDLLGNGTVLPNDRRLRPFDAQPTLLASLAHSDGGIWSEGQQLPGHLTEAHLAMWAYEDWLKGAFFRILQLLEMWCSDEIEYSRSRALDFVFGLLRSKPEQEANLLRLLVNKLGDRERKISSRASYLVLQLLDLHPGMKAVVINAIEQEVLLKPGQSLRAKYYAINTLNQTILSTKEPAIADMLLRIYFDMFLSLLKGGMLGSLGATEQDDNPVPEGKPKWRGKGLSTQKTTVQEEQSAQKLVSSLLTGVNRAIPFAASDDTTLEKHLGTLFKITHSSNFNTSVQALMLIQQLASTKHLAVERFYRTLYESLLDPRLVTSSKQGLYLNLLFRSLKNDVDVRRVKAFVKRLVQILSLHQPSFACGILFLIAELENTFPDLHALLTVPEDNGDDEEEVYKDVTGDDGSGTIATSATDAPREDRISSYDGRKRDPEHSNAHQSCLWELVPFLTHFHPSVRVFAAHLLSRQKSLPKPDLASHTLMHFLDKFVYRNPKATEAKRGTSIMQPVLTPGNAAHVVISSKASARQQPAVNSASFWNLKPGDVSAEDVFFHEYFARVGKPAQPPKPQTSEASAALSDDEEAEGEIWEALVNSRPDVEGDDVDDSDVDMDAYGDSDEELDDTAAGADGVSDLGSDSAGSFEGIFDESDGSDASDVDDVDREPAGDTEDAKRNGRLRRSKMKNLPTFASVDDYAAMLADEDEGL